MKALRTIILCLSLLMCVTISQGQEVTDSNESTISDDKLFDTVKQYDNTEYTSVNSFMIGMAKMLAGKEEKAFLDKIKSIKIVNLAQCNEEIKGQYVAFVSASQLKGYEPAIEMVNDNNTTRIFIKNDNEIVEKMVIAHLGTSIYLLMQINGELTISDLENMNPMNKEKQKQ